MAETPEEIAGLLGRLRRGDEGARNRLAAHAYERFRGLARRMLRDSAALRRWVQTDDVMQGAVTRLDRALRGAVPESPLHFYRLTVLQLRRELIDLARHHFGPHGPASRHHTDPAGKAPDDAGGPLQAQADAADDPGCGEAWARFHGEVEGLPPPEREVFELRWYQGLTLEQVEAVLGTPLRTVRRAWQRALRRLDEQLGGEWPGRGRKAND